LMHSDIPLDHRSLLSERHGLSAAARCQGLRLSAGPLVPMKAVHSNGIWDAAAAAGLPNHQPNVAHQFAHVERASGRMVSSTRPWDSSEVAGTGVGDSQQRSQIHTQQEGGSTADHIDSASTVNVVAGVTPVVIRITPEQVMHLISAVEALQFVGHMLKPLKALPSVTMLVPSSIHTRTDPTVSVSGPLTKPMRTIFEDGDGDGDADGEAGGQSPGFQPEGLSSAELKIDGEADVSSVSAPQPSAPAVAGRSFRGVVMPFRIDVSLVASCTQAQYFRLSVLSRVPTVLRLVKLPLHSVSVHDCMCFPC